MWCGDVKSLKLCVVLGDVSQHISARTNNEQRSIDVLASEIRIKSNHFLSVVWDIRNRIFLFRDLALSSGTQLPRSGAAF